MSSAWFTLNTVNRSSTNRPARPDIPDSWAWPFSLRLFVNSSYFAEQAVGGRPPRYAPPLSSPRGRLAPPSGRQRSSSFPRPTRSHAHRCSCLTRQHGGEQSGLVILTFDLLTLKVVSESRVTWATSVPILVFLGLSVLDIGPMYATDKHLIDARQTAGRRQTALSLYAPPIMGGA